MFWGDPFSIIFLDRIYKNTSLIFWENRLKMFAYKIARHCLMTKFKLSSILNSLYDLTTDGVIHSTPNTDHMLIHTN